MPTHGSRRGRAQDSPLPALVEVDADGAQAALVNDRVETAERLSETHGGLPHAFFSQE